MAGWCGRKTRNYVAAATKRLPARPGSARDLYSGRRRCRERRAVRALAFLLCGAIAQVGIAKEISAKSLPLVKMAEPSSVLFLKYVTILDVAKYNNPSLSIKNIVPFLDSEDA